MRSPASVVEEIKEQKVEVKQMEVDMSVDNADLKKKLLISPRIPSTSIIERKTEKFKIEARDIVLKSFMPEG